MLEDAAKHRFFVIFSKNLAEFWLRNFNAEENRRMEVKKQNLQKNKTKLSKVYVYVQYSQVLLDLISRVHHFTHPPVTTVRLGETTKINWHFNMLRYLGFESTIR